MISLYNWWSAQRTLDWYNKPITDQGGESKCNTYFLAQRDFTALEVEYHRDSFKKSFRIAVPIAVVAVCIFIYYYGV
jgi:hypothetical protein